MVGALVGMLVGAVRIAVLVMVAVPEIGPSLGRLVLDRPQRGRGGGRAVGESDSCKVERLIINVGLRCITRTRVDEQVMELGQ